MSRGCTSFPLQRGAHVADNLLHRHAFFWIIYFGDRLCCPKGIKPNISQGKTLFRTSGQSPWLRQEPFVDCMGNEASVCCKLLSLGGVACDLRALGWLVGGWLGWWGWWVVGWVGGRVGGFGGLLGLVGCWVGGLVCWLGGGWVGLLVGFGGTLACVDVIACRATARRFRQHSSWRCWDPRVGLGFCFLSSWPPSKEKAQSFGLVRRTTSSGTQQN